MPQIKIMIFGDLLYKLAGCLFYLFLQIQVYQKRDSKWLPGIKNHTLVIESMRMFALLENFSILAVLVQFEQTCFVLLDSNLTKSIYLHQVFSWMKHDNIQLYIL